LICRWGYSCGNSYSWHSHSSHTSWRHYYSGIRTDFVLIPLYIVFRMVKNYRNRNAKLSLSSKSNFYN
jgi:hypothetical protein